ncbi:MAG: type I-C CRISPR-associated protein Cas7/Csd2 [Rhodobacteraceae bacterium]|nr:type I-C CRISPR-associated protein Cas7/Csd2 [Paracoccaceae bacterium]
MTTLSHRHDFVLIFDVTNGNPNGDPDAGNMPRQDPETNHGWVSDVSLKRKIRNYVELTHKNKTGHKIYIQEGAILNKIHEETHIAINKEKVVKLGDARKWMCENFFDVRTFGAVMSTGKNCGQVRGPVQMTFATSVEPIMPSEITVTRMATTKEQTSKGTKEDQHSKNRTMGRKYIVPYGLYVAHGFISAKFAERTGFSEADLELLFEALKNMFEHDRSAARGEMIIRKLIVFRHDNALGNASAHSLFDRIQVGRRVNGKFRPLDDRGLGNLPPARKFSDYIVKIKKNKLPAGIDILDLI